MINSTDLSFSVLSRNAGYEATMNFFVGFDAVCLLKTAYMNAANHVKQLYKVRVS